MSVVRERERSIRTSADPHRSVGPVHELAVHRSRKRITPFRLHIAQSSPEAVSLLRELPRSCIVAGGIDVINRMKHGEPHDDIISIGRIPSLRAISFETSNVVIGATATHHDIASSSVIHREMPSVSRIWAKIANPRIRFKGTIGGNLMARSSEYEAAPILAALGADLLFRNQDGPYRIGISEYFQSPRDDPRVLLEAVSLPGNRALHLDYDRSFKGIAGVVVAVTLQGRTVIGARAAISWAFTDLVCTDLPLAARTEVSGLAVEAKRFAADWISSLPDPLDDHLASSGYRRRILAVQLFRAIERIAAAGPQVRSA